ncbi:hypothetical protein CMI37_20825 [Candidatus Pacearchaeota archaeon]|nr:hypothetical protein [Candidatus Pacearchaeota archaeon]|tara:strand:+ start:15186 stop:15578 length:393 start_codon:yes stop_codon:yes gene_type:complete
MALLPVQRKQKQTVQQGSQGGTRLGQGLGAALGAVAGGIAGGGPGGALQGAATGASLGGMAGGAIAPPKASSVETQEFGGLSTVQVAQNSQAILDGLRSLEQFPDLQAEYAQPLTQAYMASMVDLKRRSV